MSRYTIKRTLSDDTWVVEFSPFTDGEDAGLWFTGADLPTVCKKIMGVYDDAQEEPTITPIKVAGSMTPFMRDEEGNKINAINIIKTIRTLTNCGLKEAKEAYDSIWNKYYA